MAKLSSDDGTKRCSKCGETKPLDAFNKCSARPDGLHCYCRGCATSYSASYYAANKDRVKGYATRYYEANKGGGSWRNRNATWRAANKDKVRAAAARYRAANKAKAAAFAAAYHAAARRDLLDRYVKATITRGTSIKSADVPQELVELKRVQLLIKREVKK